MEPGDILTENEAQLIEQLEALASYVARHLEPLSKVIAVHPFHAHVTEQIAKINETKAAIVADEALDVSSRLSPAATVHEVSLPGIESPWGITAALAQRLKTHGLIVPARIDAQGITYHLAPDTNHEATSLLILDAED